MICKQNFHTKPQLAQTERAREGERERERDRVVQVSKFETQKFHGYRMYLSKFPIEAVVSDAPVSNHIQTTKTLTQEWQHQNPRWKTHWQNMLRAETHRN